MTPYPNGRWPTSALAAIPGGTKLGGTAYTRADLLPGLVALQTAYARRFGVPLRPTSAADGYRSYEAQVRVFLERYAVVDGVGPLGDVRYWQGRRYVRVSGASAAVPGTSNHGRAQAVDFADVGPKDGRRWSWLMDNASAFGWVNPVWARDSDPSNGSIEPWHWEGVAVPVASYARVLADLGVTVPDLTSPDPLEEDDMAGIKDDPEVQAALKGLVTEALVELDLAVATRQGQLGRNAQDAALARARVEAHHVLTGAAGGATATFRQIRAAIATLTHTPATDVVRDLDDEALAELARQVAALPDAINDELDRRAAARAQTAV